MSDELPIYAPKVEVGRADIKEIVRRFGRSAKADQAERKRNPDQEPKYAGALECVAYPVGWNHLAQIVEYECITTAKVAGLDSYLRSRGDTVKSAEVAMRRILVHALHQIRQVPWEKAKDISRKCPVCVIDVLNERPEFAK